MCYVVYIDRDFSIYFIGKDITIKQKKLQKKKTRFVTTNETGRVLGPRWILFKKSIRVRHVFAQNISVIFHVIVTVQRAILGRKIKINRVHGEGSFFFFLFVFT